MITLRLPESNEFYNFKCGEIFYTSSTKYEVACCLCDKKINFEVFPEHFQHQHLPKEEDVLTPSSPKTLIPYKIACETMQLIQPKRKRKKILEDKGNDENDALSLPGELEDLIDPIKSESEDTIFSEVPNQKSLGAEIAQEKDGLDQDILPLLDIKEMHDLVPFNERSLDEHEKPIDLFVVEQNQLNIDETNITIATETLEKPDVARVEEESTLIASDNDDWQLDDNEANSNTSLSDLEIKSHEKNMLPYPCPNCTRTYKTKRSLQHHLRVNHNPNRVPKAPKRQFKCEECGEEFRTERNLRGHRWKHTGISCDICGKPFSQAGNMERHKVRHTGIKAHQCNECDNRFYTIKELRAHMLRHTGQMSHICEICGRRCRDRGVLTAHMRRHTGERPAKCDVCGKSFYSGHDLNVHAVAHTNERPFVCDVCGSTFQRKKALRVHKKLHSEDRKHVCKICGKAFAQTSGLNSHMRTHDTAASGAKTKTDTVDADVGFLVVNGADVVDTIYGNMNNSDVKSLLVTDINSTECFSGS